MSTTPQMSQLGQQGQQGQQGQMFPSTSPYAQQPYGQGQQQPYGMSGSLEQLQQLGQQQPYQQLLQQLGQQGYGQQQQQQHPQMEQQVQQQLHQVTQAAIQQVSAQVLQAGIANGYIDIVQPLPGQPQQIFLRFPDGFRVLNNPTPQAHDEIQEAFAFGHQVVGIWDSASPAILRSVRVQRL